MRLLARLPAGVDVTLSGLRPAELRFLRRLAELDLVDVRPAWEGASWPSVTVVVPVRDRPEPLAACLASLDRLRYPAGRLAVVVVDDGSARPPAVPPGVRLVRLAEPRGPAAARNAGAAGRRSDLLAFVDSDCTVEPGWLEALVPELADPDVAAAGGRVLPASAGSWLERYEAVRSPLDLGAAPASARPRRPVPFLVTASLVVRRAAFEAAGGFDPGLRLGEDVDLCWRLAAAGHRLVYRPEAAVRHRHRGRVTAFAATRAAYAGSESPLLRRHPGNGRWLGVSAGMGAALLGIAGGLLGQPAPLAAGGLAMGLEVVATAGRLEALGLPRRRSAAALLRGQANCLYHVGRQLVRYYGLPALALALAAGRARRRRLLLGVAIATVGPAVADWRRLRPALSFPAFLAASVLDDAAYQCGLLAGCLRERSPRALAVELRLVGGAEPDA